MSCNRATDGKHDCPPRMADGRHYTDYRPRCAKNFESLPKPMSSFDYRMFLMQNAENIMQSNREHALKENMCTPCTKPTTMLPEQHVQVCDGRKCSFPVNDPQGLGVGRKYGGEQPSYRPDVEMKGCASKVQDMNFYPISGNVGTGFDNLTGPTGGWPLQ